MKITKNWITASPTLTVGTIVSGHAITNMNQSPDEVVLSERVIVQGTTATFTMTTTSVPQDVTLFDFLGNEIVLTITYTDTNSAAQTKTFTIQDQNSTVFNDWSTVFQTQSTNSWTDLDHLNSFTNVTNTTEYTLTFKMDNVENADNDIKKEITTWTKTATNSGKFNSAATYIPLGSRVVIASTTYYITAIYGSGTSDNSVTLSGDPSTGAITAIYRPISLSKCFVSTDTMEVNNPHWGMNRKRNVIQASAMNHRGRIIPLNRVGVQHDTYTLTTGFQQDMSQNFIDHLSNSGTSARPMQIISEKTDTTLSNGREWVIWGSFQGLPSESLDARNHRIWSMDIVSGII